MGYVEDMMIDADMRGDDGSYEAVVDTLAAMADDARKARKENAEPAPHVRKEHAKMLRQLKERVELLMAHAQDTQRWLSQDYPPTHEAVWRLSDAQRHLLRARNAVWAAEEKMRNE